MPLTLSVISGKWQLLIIDTIGQQPIRYGKLRNSLLGISEKVLTDALNYLIELGVVEKKSYPIVPPCVEYNLTDKGQIILPLIDSLKKLEKQLAAWLSP